MSEVAPLLRLSEREIRRYGARFKSGPFRVTLRTLSATALARQFLVALTSLLVNYTGSVGSRASPASADASRLSTTRSDSCPPAPRARSAENDDGSKRIATATGSPNPARASRRSSHADGC